MKYKLDESFSQSGGFWLPGRESSPIAGQLRYTPERGLEVELVENPNQFTELPNESSTFPIIFGKLVDGTLVSLFNAFTTRWTHQFGAGLGSPTVLFVPTALINGHVESLGAIRVQSYTVEIPSLEIWLGQPPIVPEILGEGNEVVGQRIELIAQPPQVFELSQLGLRVEFSVGQLTDYRISELNISIHANARVVFAESATFDEASSSSWHLQCLLSLLVGSPLRIRSAWISAILSGPGKEAKNDPIPLWLLFSPKAPQVSQPDVILQMRLDFSEISDQFPQIMERWYSLPDQARLAINIFFNSLFLPSTSLEFQFLAAVQSIESYDRSLGESLYMDQTEYDSLIAAVNRRIPNEIAGDHRESIKNRLRYGNDYSLRRRLKNLLTRIPPDVATRVAGDTTQFANRITNTRNFLTHYDAASKAAAATSKELFIATEKLRLLLAINLLHDLGVNDQRLHKVLDKNKIFTQMAFVPRS